jgi:hypothetical protein
MKLEDRSSVLHVAFAEELTNVREIHFLDLDRFTNILTEKPALHNLIFLFRRDAAGGQP